MNGRMNTIVSMPTLLSTSLLVAVAWSGALAAEEQVSYNLDVQPILQSRCSACHQPGGQGYQTSGLDLTSYEGLMQGTKYGPIVVPGDPLTSNLIVLVEGRARPEVRMPHGQRPLLKQQTEILRLWVKQGAKNN
jgi:mono/diheme cytochrome c family protein